MKIETTKRYVKVENQTYAENNNESSYNISIKDSDIAIYDTKNYPFYKIQGKLFKVINLSKGFEEPPTNKYECLGTIVDEFDEIEGLFKRSG